MKLKNEGSFGGRRDYGNDKLDNCFKGTKPDAAILLAFFIRAAILAEA